MDDDLFDGSTSHGEENKILLSNEVEFNILASVECQLNIREKIHIVIDLGIERNNLSKLLQRHGWQGVCHHKPIPNLKNINSIVVPLQKGGSNWGIKIIQIVLWLIPLNVPKATMTYALHELQVENMRC